MSSSATLLAVVYLFSNALAAQNYGGLDASELFAFASSGMSTDDLGNVIAAADQQTSESTSSSVQTLINEIHNQAKTMSKFVGAYIASDSIEKTNDLTKKSGELSKKAHSMLLDIQKLIDAVQATAGGLQIKYEQIDHQSTALVNELIGKLTNLEGSLSQISDSKTAKNIHKLIYQTAKDRESISKMLVKRSDKMLSNAKKIKKSLYEIAEKLEEEFYKILEKMSQSTEYESETSEMMISMINEITSKVNERISDAMSSLGAQAQSTQASVASSNFVGNNQVSSVPAKRRRSYNQATSTSINNFSDLEGSSIYS